MKPSNSSNNADGKQQREWKIWAKTEPNKSPNQHHQPHRFTNRTYQRKKCRALPQIGWRVTTKQAQALTNRTKQNTNHRAKGKLRTRQTGKREKTTKSPNQYHQHHRRHHRNHKNHRNHKSINWIRETQMSGDSPIGAKTEHKSEDKGEIGTGN